MSNKRTALAGLMDSFARENWNDRFSGERGELAIDGDVLSCTVEGERIQGHPAAPFMFVSGAWALIYAHETGDRYGHRVDGRINRVWPNGTDHSSRFHNMDEKALVAWSRLWPGTVFSSGLYRGVDAPGQPHHPRGVVEGPGNTTLAGIMKHAVKTVADPDPVERMKVAGFILDNLGGWSSTGEDHMMKIIGAPLMALSGDAEPATRELALLALDACACRCREERAYGLYEPICARLIEAGLNAHLQYVRLAESAYASGNIEEGDRCWATAEAGQNPLRAMRLSQAYDHIGDWGDLKTRVLRQAGGANVGYMLGNDPNPARHARLEKKGIKPAQGEDALRYRELARVLLARAAEGADARLAIDIPAIREGRNVPLGPGEIDPRRRLFVAEIFALQARVAEADGDRDEELRLMFKALSTEWALEGEPEHYAGSYDNAAIELSSGRSREQLQQLGMPDYFTTILDARQADEKLAESDTGREQLSFRNFMLTVFNQLLEKTDGKDFEDIPAAQIASGFTFDRRGIELSIGHVAVEKPVTGQLTTPLPLALKAWNQALRASIPRSKGARINAWPSFVVTIGAEDLPLWEAIARETFLAGSLDEAVTLYRFACGTDPLIQPWPYRDPVPPVPLEQVPEEIRPAVAARCALENDLELWKLKPRGRRIETLAALYDQGDIVSARYIGHMLREACHVGESELPRALKAGQPLLLKLLGHPDPTVREGAILPSIELVQRWKQYAPNLDGEGLLNAVNALGLVRLST